MASILWEVAERYMTAKYGETWEFFAINRDTPVKSVRENVAMYFGGHVKVSTNDAYDIISELESYGYEWMNHEPTGTTFMAGDPNHFMTATASIIEM